MKVNENSENWQCAFCFEWATLESGNSVWYSVKFTRYIQRSVGKQSPDHKHCSLTGACCDEKNCRIVAVDLQLFKDEYNWNGDKSLAPMNEFGNTFLYVAALEQIKDWHFIAPLMA